jgi:hypothetical protein
MQNEPQLSAIEVKNYDKTTNLYPEEPKTLLIPVNEPHTISAGNPPTGTYFKEPQLSYETTYSVINRGDGIRCAWCNRLLSEIGNFEEAREHLARHDERQKVLAEVDGQWADIDHLYHVCFEIVDGEPRLIVQKHVQHRNCKNCELRAKLAEMKEAK